MAACADKTLPRMRRKARGLYLELRALQADWDPDCTCCQEPTIRTTPCCARPLCEECFKRWREKDPRCMNCRALIGALNSAHPPVLTRHVRRTWITGHTEISLRPLMRTMNEGVDDTFIASPSIFFRTVFCVNSVCGNISSIEYFLLFLIIFKSHYFL